MGQGGRGDDDRDKSRTGTHGYTNKGLDTPSVYTIDSVSSDLRRSMDTLTTGTHTPGSRTPRRASLETACSVDGDLMLDRRTGSELTMPGSCKSGAVSTDGLIQGSSTESVKERETWDNKFQYILAVVGYAVGLGNVWRFPYLAQKNGGGAFLIPYTIMLAIEGIPIFYLELAVGQRLRKGAVGAWGEVSPYLGGIGIACAFVSFWVALYYNTIIAWCLYYLVRSFQSPLPWASCPTVQGGISGNQTVVQECQLSSPTTYFWYREALNIAPSVEEGGSPNWWIVVCLLVAWLIVFLCMIKGIASSGKVVYVTATFPYLVLVIFFFRGVTLDGFEQGLKHFFVPEVNVL